MLGGFQEERMLTQSPKRQRDSYLKAGTRFYPKEQGSFPEVQVMCEAEA
jgi:hypothetical protein